MKRLRKCKPHPICPLPNNPNEAGSGTAVAVGERVRGASELCDEPDRAAGTSKTRNHGAASNPGDLSLRCPRPAFSPGGYGKFATRLDCGGLRTARHSCRGAISAGAPYSSPGPSAAPVWGSARTATETLRSKLRTERSAVRSPMSSWPRLRPPACRGASEFELLCPPVRCRTRTRRRAQALAQDPGPANT
jgi:hypothetical protein